MSGITSLCSFYVRVHYDNLELLAFVVVVVVVEVGVMVMVVIKKIEGRKFNSISLKYY